LARWRELVRNRDWKVALQAGVNTRDLTAMRQGTMTGRPQGNDSWLAKLEVSLGRRLRPLPVGRQKGWRKKPK